VIIKLLLLAIFAMALVGICHWIERRAERGHQTLWLALAAAVMLTSLIVSSMMVLH
jgi:hypothetical protein